MDKASGIGPFADPAKAYGCVTQQIGCNTPRALRSRQQPLTVANALARRVPMTKEPTRVRFLQYPSKSACSAGSLIYSRGGQSPDRSARLTKRVIEPHIRSARQPHRSECGQIIWRCLARDELVTGLICGGAYACFDG